MAHTVKEILAGFATLHGSIAGVQTASTALPSAIDTEDCPLAMTLPGPAVWADNSTGIWLRQRTYNVYVYVAPIMSDMPMEGAQEVFDLLDRFAEAYMDDPTIGGTVFETTRIADRGYAQLVMNRVAYHGFIFDVTVNERC